MILQGWTLAQQEDGASGIEQIRQGIDTWHATGARAIFPYFVCLLAEACARAGQIGDGLAAVAEGLETASRTNEHFYHAELYRIRGELLIAQKQSTRAEHALLRACAIAREQGARSFEGRATHSLSHL